MREKQVLEAWKPRDRVWNLEDRASSETSELLSKESMYYHTPAGCQGLVRPCSCQHVCFLWCLSSVSCTLLMASGTKCLLMCLVDIFKRGLWFGLTFLFSRQGLIVQPKVTSNSVSCQLQLRVQACATSPSLSGMFYNKKCIYFVQGGYMCIRVHECACGGICVYMFMNVHVGVYVYTCS